MVEKTLNITSINNAKIFRSSYFVVEVLKNSLN